MRNSSKVRCKLTDMENPRRVFVLQREQSVFLSRDVGHRASCWEQFMSYQTFQSVPDANILDLALRKGLRMWRTATG